MLVLSRKVGQELVIGNDIRIVINRVAGNRVALGIEAPGEVPILRGELQEVRDSFSGPLPDESARPLSSELTGCELELVASIVPHREG